MTSLAFNSINSFVHYLKESDVDLKTVALHKLQNIVDHNWIEIADHLPLIESLFEDESFPERELAAHLASKVYYHLEEYDESLHYALESKSFLKLSNRDQYIETILDKCIDQYTSLQQENYESSIQKPITPKLIEIVESLLELSINEGDYKNACGIALDIRRLDIIRVILDKAKARNYSEILGYLFELAKTVVHNINFRGELLRLIIESYKNKELFAKEYSILSQCYFLCEDSQSLATLLYSMLGEENLRLLAYQIAQELSENENKGFINQIIGKFPTINLNESNDVQKNIETNIKPKLLTILNGKLGEELSLLFLNNKNQTDKQVIANVKTAGDSKNSILHEAVIIANSIFQCGTTNQSFMVDNLDWVSKASHWSKFTSISSLGVIHRNNHAKAMDILKPYFPSASGTPNYYAHGGAYYGLGLIHAGTNNPEILNFLISAIKSPANNQNETLIHGACLGIGLVGMASNDEGLYEEMKNVLFTDSATTGEAAGIAIGLLMAGSKNGAVIQEILDYARETKHEKLIRSIGISIALIMFGAEEHADVMIEELCNDKDAILRYTAMFLIGLAYVGKSKNKSISKLLHHASADFSDDVRRAAVINLAFVLINSPDQIIKILNLLALSYNPHVRYGVAIALGISLANTAQPEAVSLLESMLNDAIGFVRQGAFLALSMILQQANEISEPKVSKFRATIKETYGKKQEDVLCRMGAILANGILDAGGRNASLSLISSFGFPKLFSCVGMTVFLQFWYWFPFTHFISLSLAPKALIGVNNLLKVPQSFKFTCNAKKSLFDYPEHLKTEQKEAKKETTKVELSITNKAKARAAKKAHDKDGMEIEPGLSKGPSLIAEQSKVEEKKEVIVEEKKIEPNFFEIENPARILNKQEKYISYNEDNCRYIPIMKEKKSGIVFLFDRKPDESDTFFDSVPLPVIKEENPNPVPNAQASRPSAPDTNNSLFEMPEEFIFDEDSQKKK